MDGTPRFLGAAFQRSLQPQSGGAVLHEPAAVRGPLARRVRRSRVTALICGGRAARTDFGAIDHGAERPEQGRSGHLGKNSGRRPKLAAALEIRAISQRRLFGGYGGDDCRCSARGVAGLGAAAAARFRPPLPGGVGVICDNRLGLNDRTAGPVCSERTRLDDSDFDTERCTFDRR
jgi:hypothetical protein